jgi:hypothetical protein
MAAKLHSSNLLRPPYPFGGWLGTAAPHLLYANLEFGKANTAAQARSLLEIKGWTNVRALRFLEQNQQTFRRCLEWLSNGSLTNFGLDDDGSDCWNGDMREMWEQQPEVRFLQDHGLDHGKPVLEPVWQDGSFFNGIALNKTEPKDPLDPICWYMLALLAWDGTVGVLRCKYAKCGKFFRPATKRRLFCCDACRAKAAAAKKAPEEKSAYMRDYRKRRDLRKRRRKR